MNNFQIFMLYRVKYHILLKVSFNPSVICILKLQDEQMTILLSFAGTLRRSFLPYDKKRTKTNAR